MEARDDRAEPRGLTPEERAFFDKQSFVFLATVGPDGTPHVTPVWADMEDGLIAINTARGRTKLRNLERDPRVGVSAVDPDNPYRMVSVRGRVVEITTDGADEHIDHLARKYTSHERYPWREPGEQRVKVLIRPDRVVAA